MLSIKTKQKKTAFEGGAVMQVECKVTGQSAPNYLLTAGISYQDASLRAEMHVVSPVCFAKYCIFILHASYPLQRLRTECCEASRQRTPGNCTTYVTSRQCHRHLWPPRDKAFQCLGLPFHNQGNLCLCPLPSYLSLVFYLVNVHSFYFASQHN